MLCCSWYLLTPLAPSVADHVSLTGTLISPSCESVTKPCAGGCALGPVVSTVQVRLAGVVSTLPAVSIALTWKVCEPSAKVPCSGTVLDEVQLVKAAPSRLHWKVEPASEEEKLKLAECCRLVPLYPSLEAALPRRVGGILSGLWRVYVPAVGAPTEEPSPAERTRRRRSFAPRQSRR